RRKQREARVAAGRVGDRADDPRVDVSVLLGEVISIRQLDATIAGSKPAEACPDKPHRALPIEAQANPSLEVRIGRDSLSTGARKGCKHGQENGKSSFGLYIT